MFDLMWCISKQLHGQLQQVPTAYEYINLAVYETIDCVLILVNCALITLCFYIISK